MTSVLTNLLSLIKEKTNGYKTLASIGGLVLVGLSQVDMTTMTSNEWLTVLGCLVFGASGVWGYEDVKKRMAKEKDET